MSILLLIQQYVFYESWKFMFIALSALGICVLPGILLYLLLKNNVRQPQDEAYRKACSDAFYKGLLSTVGVVILSFILRLIGNLLGLPAEGSVPGAFYHTFFVLAFAEELMKTMMFLLVLKKAAYTYTWLDMIIFMTVVSLAFGLLENAVYAFGANPMVLVLRGVLLMHGVYGFLEGWFYGRAKHSGKQWMAVCGFVLVWILHGAYDFGLRPEPGDEAALLPVLLACFSLGMVLVMIRFFARKKKPKYLEPIGPMKNL